MIVPEHSRLIGVVEVDEDLDEEKIKSIARDKKVYFSSDYVVLYNPKTNKASILHVEREGMEPFSAGKGIIPSGQFVFLRRVKKVEVLSTMDETVVVRNNIDVMNKSQLVSAAAKIAKREGARAVVFFGNFNHVNFVIDPEEARVITVVDLVPPYPSRLIETLKLLQASEFRSQPFEFYLEPIDLLRIAEDLVEEHRPSLVVFPCSASNISKRIGSAKTCFINKEFEVKDEKVLLIGCEVTEKVFRERFPEKRFIFHNVCPRRQNIRGLFITRCCRREGLGLVYTDEGKGYVVHWGATQEEIASGIRELLK
jgi:hypothetical protein